MADNLIQTLESKITDLIKLSAELNRENQKLKMRTAELQRERKELLERQREASERVAATIDKLRKIEGNA